MGDRSDKGNTKADVSNSRFLGEATSECKIVRVASKGTYRGTQT